MYFLTLDKDGGLVALVIGGLVLVFGLGFGPFFLAVMVYFLVLSAIVTFIGMKKKKFLKLFEKRRRVNNVLANGLQPLFMVFLFYYAQMAYLHWLSALAFVGFLSGIATVTADKFSSELGVLDGMPRMIFTFRRVRKGTSGGITIAGLLAGLLGSFLIAISLFAVSGLALSYYNLMPLKSVPAIMLGGFLGTVMDSVFGYFEENGVGNKFSSNFLASIVGSVVGMLIIWL